MKNMAEETPRNLVAATETILLEKGHAGATLREITNLAGANVAAVAYHFGSKDELVAKVFQDALIEVTKVQSRAIDDLPEDATLRDVVVTWLSPALNPSGTTKRHQNLWALIHRGALEQAPGLVSAAAGFVTESDNSLFTRLAKLLPDVPRPVLLLRHDLVLGGVSAVFGSSLQASADPRLPTQLDPNHIVDWVIGGLSAGVTSN
jgi:AcrR family transcriptional regulator